VFYGIFLTEKTKNMKKEIGPRKLSLNKKTIAILNKNRSLLLLGGTFTTDDTTMVTKSTLPTCVTDTSGTMKCPLPTKTCP
jgi:hypothetical protein